MIEVDGQQHYTAGGHPDHALYARTMRADRDLKLRGYEVYRFGAHELRDPAAARPMVEKFFRDLFRSCRIPC